jgi:hypothetical protein
MKSAAHVKKISHSISIMMFYSIKEKKPIKVKESDVSYRMTSNGRRQAVANLSDGQILYKFVKSQK